MAQKKGSNKTLQKEKKPQLDIEPVELPDDFPSELVEIIEKLPDEKSKRQVISVFSASVRIHKGPLPPPEDFEAYDKVMPGAAKEILDMAKAQVAHRIDIERTVVKHGKIQENWTQAISGLIIFSLIACGVLAMYWENSIVSGVIFGTTIVSVAVAWLTGKVAGSKSKHK